MSKEKKTKSKRANGEGTFYQQEDKTWVHQITVGTKPDGRPDRKTFTGKTRAICIERRDAYIAEKTRLDDSAKTAEAAHLLALAEAEKRGHTLESEILFSEAFPKWLELFKAPPNKKASTYSSYIDTYAGHLKGFFGDMSLYEITLDVVQRYYKEKQLDGSRRDGRHGGLSPKTIRNQHMLLKDFFDYATSKYKLEDNPTHRTERPAVITPPMRVLEPDEMYIFLQEVLRETQKVAILFCLFTGLRVGELLAAEVSDLDTNQQGIEITRNVTRVKTESIDTRNANIRILDYNPEKKTHIIVQSTPKTKNSHRFLPISDELFMLLAKHLYYLEQSAWPNPNNLLFPSTKGTYIDPKSFEIRLNAVSKRCEIRKVNPHALRHTFATRLVEQNVPLTTIMELLGHSSVSTTQRYVTTFVEEKREAVEKFSSILNPGGLEEAKRLNGTKARMKFSDVRLPSWLQIEPKPEEN
jgi:integrase